jgi:hypothetical protein
MSSTIAVGLAVTSHNVSTVSTVIYDNVKLTQP